MIKNFKKLKIILFHGLKVCSYSEESSPVGLLVLIKCNLAILTKWSICLTEFYLYWFPFPLIVYLKTLFWCFRLAIILICLISYPFYFSDLSFRLMILSTSKIFNNWLFSGTFVGIFVLLKIELKVFYTSIS